MKYNFDEKINRKNTNCEKHDALKKYFGKDDLQALWVADMDFKTPSFINDKILAYGNKSVYGYSLLNDDLYSSIISWQKNMHSWEINKENITICNGVVPSYSAAIEAFCPNETDEVIVQTPIYPPLFSCVTMNNRKLILNPLKEKNGYYTMDFKDLENKITKNTKLLALCSPHNPVGRVWNKEELTNLSLICKKHNITIISDEIHADMSFKKFTPLASISEEIAQITLTLNSAGKTFNIAGLNTSYAISKNKKILEKFTKIAKKRYVTAVNSFGTIATQTAYEEGKEYVQQLKNYLRENINFTKKFLEEENKKISFHIPEATYLLWLNFKETGLSHKEVKEILLNKSKLALNDGVSFGDNGEAYFRLNLALSKDQLKVALQKLCKEF